MSQHAKRIIEAYLAAGGAAMDEEHYQKYKDMMLSSWIYQYYDYDNCCLDCIRVGNYESYPTHEAAIDHQRMHHPEWFLVDDGREKRDQYKRNRRKQKEVAHAQQREKGAGR